MPGLARIALLTVAFAGAAVNGGCGMLLTAAAPCSWLEVTSPAEKDGPRHTGRTRCGQVGTYRVTRSAYTLELWNGRMDSQELSVRVVAPDGGHFSVRSQRFVPLSSAQKLPRYAGDRRPDYDYHLDLSGSWSSSVSLELPATLTIVVVDDRGREIGTETVRIEKRTGTYRYSTIEL